MKCGSLLAPMTFSIDEAPNNVMTVSTIELLAASKSPLKANPDFLLCFILDIL